MEIIFDIIGFLALLFALFTGIVFSISILGMIMSLLGFHIFDRLWTFFGDGMDDSYGG